MTILFFTAWLGGFIVTFAVVSLAGDQPTGAAAKVADALLIVTLVGNIGLAYVAVRRHLTGTAALGGSGVTATVAELTLLLLGLRLPEAFRAVRS